MKHIFLLLIAISIISCGDDDEYGAPLEYTICGDELLPETDRIDQNELSVTEWPTTLRSYVTTEFTGFSISTIQSYKDAQGSEFLLATMDNQGILLFDGSSAFICGDESYSLASGDDEDINYEDLPQAIKDYITENYPSTSVDEAEFEDGKYEIELKDGTEICFDQLGDFLGEC